MQEVWLPVFGYEGLYAVSDLSRVKSLDRVVVRCDGRQRRFPGVVLTQWVNSNGYLAVNLSKNGVCKAHPVHVLVAAAFIGPRPSGLQVHHGPARQRNNSPSNLSYGTAKENAADRLRDGTDASGERNGRSKLTNAQVLQIRRLLENAPRGTTARLAREFGVSFSTVSMIKRGRTWAEGAS